MMRVNVEITDGIVIVSEEEGFWGGLSCLYTTLITAPELIQYQDPCPESSGIL